MWTAISGPSRFETVIALLLYGVGCMAMTATKLLAGGILREPSVTRLPRSARLVLARLLRVVDHDYIHRHIRGFQPKTKFLL
jgi:hypothetical protein